MELVWEIAGWAGAAAILGAYLTVSMGWVRAGRGFQAANLLGACAFIINGTFHEAWPSVATNIAWFLISGVALFRLRSKNHPAAADPQHVQFPGITDDTGQLPVVKVLPAIVQRSDRATVAPSFIRSRGRDEHEPGV
jgi:hypothetical protein